MVVVGLGEGQGEVKGEGWWDPPRVLLGSPSTTSPPCPPPPSLSGDEESLCSVFSGLERLEEDEEEEDEEEDEVVEDDSVQAGWLTVGSSAAGETLSVRREIQHYLAVSLKLFNTFFLPH